MSDIGQRVDVAGINETQDQIIAEFAGLDDWFDKYEHLIDLGKNHESLESRFHTDENALPGCQSQVWICAALTDGRMEVGAESDSVIMRGVLSLLLRALNGHRPDEVASADLYFLGEIGLTTNLSPTRANGVATIVRHVQQLAADLRDA